MSFLTPLAWIGLISIPAIIVMYLMKSKYTDMKVPSLFLWKEAISISRAERPWQKLRRSLLMLMQLLLAFFLVFALANPYVSAREPVDHTILVLDASMSMAAADAAPFRFEKARKDMIAMVSSAEPGAKITLIVGSDTPYIAVNGSADKKTVIDGIKATRPTFAPMDVKAAAALAAMAASGGDCTLYVFTDKPTDGFGELPKTDVLYGQSAGNTALELVGASPDAGRVVALVKVKNYGPDTVRNNVSLYCDGMFHDLKDVTVPPFDEKDVYFTSAPADALRLEARLETTDVLAADDVAYDVVPQPVSQRVMLVTERNVFLENVLGLLPGVELLKTTPANMEGLSGCYLYVFDGALPETLPTDGHMLVFNPPMGNALIETGEETPVSGISSRDSALLKLVGDFRFDVAKARALTAPAWADAVLTGDETPLILSGQLGNQKIVVMGFDLHNTDLPLKKEFPIFMYNLIQHFIPGGVTDGVRALAGSPVALNIYPDAKKVSVVTPDERMVTIAPPFPAQPFTDTGLPGFYTVVQELEGETRYNTFAVNVWPEESDLFHAADADEDSAPGGASAGETGAAGASVPVNKNMTPVFLTAALILLCAEWWVFGRGR